MRCSNLTKTNKTMLHLSYSERLTEAQVELNNRMQKLWQEENYNPVERIKVMMQISKEFNVYAEDLA